MTGRIEKVWLEFERMVMPAGADAVQRTEMRKAFYAGGFGTFTELYGMLDGDGEPTENDLAKVMAMYEEFKEFFRIEAKVEMVTFQKGRSN